MTNSLINLYNPQDLFLKFVKNNANEENISYVGVKIDKDIHIFKNQGEWGLIDPLTQVSSSFNYVASINIDYNNTISRNYYIIFSISANGFKWKYMQKEHIPTDKMIIFRKVLSFYFPEEKFYFYD